MAGRVMSMSSSGIPGLKELLANMDEKGAAAVLDGVHDWGDYVYDIEQQVCPTDSGNLALGTELIKTDQGVRLRNAVPYARPVHFGYKRHFVKPKRRKALKWEVGRKERLSVKGKRKDAKFAFSKGHYVPKDAARSKPNPWMFNAWDRAMPALKEFILEAFNKIIT